MRPIPLDGVTLPAKAEKWTMGDPLHDMIAVEYFVEQHDDGYPVVSCLVELDDDDRGKVANGGLIQLSFHGGELPWNLQVVADA